MTALVRIVSVTLLLLTVPLAADAQGSIWERHVETTQRAFSEGRHVDAEEAWLAAIKEAEAHGPDNPSLAQSLSSLGNLYRNQNRNERAAQLLERALAIQEKVYGPENGGGPIDVEKGSGVSSRWDWRQP